MRILHTADWHLGKKLDHFSRHEEQIKILQEIVHIADEQDVDLVIIAGDLFDNFNPSNESLELYYHTLKALTNEGHRPVFAIAGNHDSPDKINTTDVLAKSLGIFCFGHPKQKLGTVPEQQMFKILHSEADFTILQLKKYDYPIRIIHTPYANEQRLQEVFESGNEDWALNKALEKHWHHIANKHCDNQGVNLLMTHLFMINKEQSLDDFKEPEGERPLSLGTATLISGQNVPPQIQYVALGHLHKYIHWKNETTHFVYSGSPLAYSFAEAQQQKQVIITDLTPGNAPKIERIPLTTGRNINRLQAESITEAIHLLTSYPEDLIELTLLTEQFITQEELKSLRASHDFIIRLIPIPKNLNKTSFETEQSLEDQDINELFIDYFKSRHQTAPNTELLDLFKEITYQ